MADKETMAIIKQMVADGQISQAVADKYFPELKSEDERIRADIEFFIAAYHKDDEEKARWLYWLKKQGEQKPAMIQWKGDNLREIIDFTGCSPKFGEWFKTWEEYEKYVHSHNNIFKIFNEDGSHMEIPVDSWIIKAPDGYNTASRFGFVPRPADWIPVKESIYIKDVVLAQKKDKSDLWEGYTVITDHTLDPLVFESYIKIDNICPQRMTK